MEYWLMKSEPSTWSWEQQVKVGLKGEGWDGVRNYQASNNMKKMKKGDLCFFYHSVKERDIIGIVKVKKSRLSVMPIDAKSWKIICNLGGIK